MIQKTRLRIIGDKLKENQTPNWLAKIQNNSWEPEILISGFSIAFFFILPKYIYNFTAMLIQDFGANAFLSSVQYGMMIVIITSLQVLFMGHLTLRGFWAGLVGLSYVFPNGIKKDSLDKELQNCTFKKPVDLVIAVERICSLIFSFAFIIILFLIKLIVMYAVLIAGFILLYSLKLNSKETTIVQLSLVILATVVFIMFQRQKKKRLVKNPASSLTSNLIYTFTTNVSKKTMVLFLLVFTIITIPLSYSSISKFRFDVQDGLRNSKSGLTYVDENNYLNKRENGLRIQRAAVGSFLVDKDYLELYISSYKSDEILIRDIQENYDKYKTIMPEIEANELNQTGIYKIFIDDEHIFVNDWLLKKDTEHSQKFLTTYIPVDSLSNGIHTLTVRRVRWDRKKKDFELIENWASIPFKIKQQK